MEEPVAVFVFVGAELNGLEVGAGVGLGEDHGAGDLALGEGGQVLLLEFLGGEGVDRLGDALEAEDVHEGGVGAGDDLGGHGVEEVGEVETSEAVGQGEAHDLGLGELLERLGDAGGAGDGAIFVEGVALTVDALGARGDEIGAEFAHGVEDHLVVLDGLGRVAGGVVEFLGEAEALFQEGGEAAQVDVLKEELDVVVVAVKVAHGYPVVLSVLRVLAPVGILAEILRSAQDDRGGLLLSLAYGSGSLPVRRSS